MTVVLKRARTADVLRVPTADNFHSETKETRVKKSGVNILYFYI